MGSRWLSRLTVAAAAAGALLLLTVNAASADGTVPLHEPHIGSTAAGFGTQICGDENFEPGPDGYDAWHFVYPGNPGTGFLSLTVNFGANGSVTVTAAGGGPNSSYIRSDNPMHAYVFTPAGWTLTGGTATVSGTPAQGAKFVLSHTCPGSGGGSSPSPSPSDGDGGGSSSPPGNGGGGGGGGLPVTGTAVGAILVAGLGLLGAGVVLLVVRRRRDVFES
ncbi:MAG TPA: LPXTG cell wall anchor domain-containing protein [Micromonosporaceae bacterium]|nr:LPXTG cell wall anchor domain-containing protein [Micromonosporaceae bacterium]